MSDGKCVTKALLRRQTAEKPLPYRTTPPAPPTKKHTSVWYGHVIEFEHSDSQYRHVIEFEHSDSQYRHVIEFEHSDSQYRHVIEFGRLALIGLPLNVLAAEPRPVSSRGELRGLSEK